jgi:Tol biopolymer transport system component
MAKSLNCSMLVALLWGMLLIASPGHVARYNSGVTYLPVVSRPSEPRVVFEVKPSFGDIWSARSDGTGIRPVKETVDDWESQPGWSPDGAQIVYTLIYALPENRIPAGLYVTQADGTGSRFLTTGREAAWSPLGDRIALVDEGRVHLISPDGTGRVTLAGAPPAATTPAWSPDGTTIAFAAPVGVGGVNPRSHIFIMDADGSNLRQLTTGNQDFTNPAFSPDGQRLAIGGDGIYLMGTDGSGLTRLTQAPPPGPPGTPRFFFYSHIEPAWSPDGATLIFTELQESTPYRGYTLYQVAVDGGEPWLWMSNARGADWVRHSE